MLASCEFYFPQNQNSNKSAKVIVHKIHVFALCEALNETIHYYYDKPMCLVFDFSFTYYLHVDTLN